LCSQSVRLSVSRHVSFVRPSSVCTSHAGARSLHLSRLRLTDRVINSRRCRRRRRSSSSSSCRLCCCRRRSRYAIEVVNVVVTSCSNRNSRRTNRCRCSFRNHLQLLSSLSSSSNSVVISFVRFLLIITSNDDSDDYNRYYY